ncbi:MAG TPA: FAD-binding oxidoreductase [Gaiellaceae bacterium]|nr:FAD-binding oxidoreductase [Gaiellaceae bacterium]
MNGLARLTDRFAGEIILPDDPGYDAARAVWNGSIDRRPALVVRPTGTEDVVSALRFAREQDLVVAVRCGGHSIPGLSTCDDGIVIDLSRIRGAHVDPERRTARVGGGSLLAELDDAAQAYGLVCPVGVVSHTGVAGLTLGGGMGRLQRKLGLTIDSLVAVEVVTADGRLVRASEDEHADLFWGMRGAGPNFGIVTAFEFRLHPFDGRVVHGSVSLPIERAEELAGHFHELVENGPDDLWVSFALTVRPDVPGGAVATVSVMHCGSEADANRDLAALRAVDGSLDGRIEPKQYLSMQRVMDEPMAWGQRFSYKSAFLSSLPDDLVRSWAEHTPRLPEGADGGFSIWAWGRAIAAVREEDTAFTGRAASFWAGTEAFWRDPELDDACRSWARTGNALAERHALVGRYVNDVVEVGEDVVRSVYGDVKYERLVALKREWDPDNVFRLNQNIRP